MNWIQAHKIELLIGAWILFLLMLWRMWHVRKSTSHRYMSPIQLFFIILAFIISAVYVIERHKQFWLMSSLAWAIMCIAMGVVFYRKSMRIKMELDHKTQLIKIPMFFFRIIFYFYVPYILVYFSLLTWNESLFNDRFFVLFIMLFKGTIAGIYLGFSVAALIQVYIDDEKT